MKTGRRGVCEAIVRVVLAGAILAWPLSMSTVGAVPPEGGAPTGVATATGEGQSITLIDPATGQVIAADAVPAESQVALPPGDIGGSVLEADGVTPQANVTVALRDAKTGEVMATVTTDAEGKYLFTDVPEGLYVVQVGEPGIGVVVQVTAGAEATPLNVVLPDAATSKMLGGAAQWMQAHPVLGATVLAGGGGLLVTASYGFVAAEEDKAARISPITP